MSVETPQHGWVYIKKRAHFTSDARNGNIPVQHGIHALKGEIIMFIPFITCGIPIPKFIRQGSSSVKTSSDGYDNPIDALRRACEVETPVVDYRDFISTTLGLTSAPTPAEASTPQSPCTPSVMPVEYRDSVDREASDSYNPYMSTEPEDEARKTGLVVEEADYSTCDYEYRKGNATSNDKVVFQETASPLNPASKVTIKAATGSAPTYSYVQVPMPASRATANPGQGATDASCELNSSAHQSLPDYEIPTLPPKVHKEKSSPEDLQRTDCDQMPNYESQPTDANGFRSFSDYAASGVKNNTPTTDPEEKSPEARPSIATCEIRSITDNYMPRTSISSDTSAATVVAAPTGTSCGDYEVPSTDYDVPSQASAVANSSAATAANKNLYGVLAATPPTDSPSWSPITVGKGGTESPIYPCGMRAPSTSSDYAKLRDVVPSTTPQNVPRTGPTSASRKSSLVPVSDRKCSTGGNQELYDNKDAAASVPLQQPRVNRPPARNTSAPSWEAHTRPVHAGFDFQAADALGSQQEHAPKKKFGSGSVFQPTHKRVVPGGGSSAHIRRGQSDPGDDHTYALSSWAALSLGPLVQPMAVPTTPFKDAPWFHGNLSRADAESKLRMSSAQGHPEGLFLVRATKQGDDILCISVKYPRQEKIYHNRVRKMHNGQYEYVGTGSNSTRFMDFAGLINHHHQDHPRLSLWDGASDCQQDDIEGSVRLATYVVRPKAVA
eukprot:m.1173169 g.1173169  ORF g.1173169 m.1173169 type:complete len:724 (+) comp24520_c0_seq8:186-2357(+)